MQWPINIELPPGTRVEGSAFGEHITLDRHGDSIDLSIGKRSWAAGLPANGRKVLMGPALGERPFLLLPDPTLIVPAHSHLVVDFTIPMHLDIAVDDVRVRTVAPPALSRALYGPVDSGVICWSIRPLEPTFVELRIAGVTQQLGAKLRVSCENKSDAPVDVSRVMVPFDMVGLYATKTELRLSDVTMAILGEAVAELTMEPPTGATILADVTGEPITPTRRIFAFSHTYRNRTGLDYGF